MNNLKRDYENACNAYLKAFSEKHGYYYDPELWVAGDVGTIVSVGDEYVDMDDIRTDIDRDAPVDEFIKWYDYCLRLTSINATIHIPNYYHWLLGCPRKTEQEILRIESLHKQVKEAENALEDAIAQFKF